MAIVDAKNSSGMGGFPTSLTLGGPRRDPFRLNRGARNAMFTKARYAAGFGDMDGVFGKIGKGISKAASVTKKVATKAGSVTAKAAVYPIVAPTLLASKFAGGALSTTAKIVGTAIKAPFKALAAGGSAVKEEFTPAASPSSGGSAASGGSDSGPYSSSQSPSGGGGGGGGGDTESKSQGLGVEPPPGMPLPVKLAIGAGAAAGLYFLYKKFGKGGASGARSKSR